jgi:hypothetical protein
MLHMLQIRTQHYQRLTGVAGESLRHDCDMWSKKVSDLRAPGRGRLCGAAGPVSRCPGPEKRTDEVRRRRPPICLATRQQANVGGLLKKKPRRNSAFCFMTCRLFIDEVGNDDTVTVSERYLSLTGITTKIRAHELVIQPEIERLKSRIFGHNPPQWSVILHRKEIVRKERPFFDCLRDPKINEDWENSLLTLIRDLPYIANTVAIDKQEHAQKYVVWQFNPYHYCMRALVERYVLWLNRHGLTGDVVVEARFKKQDKKLKRSFNYIYDHGTEHIPAAIIQKRLTSREIKFETKEANVGGLQLVEMIGHPSFLAMRSQFTGIPMTARFGLKVVDILLKHRYSRHPQKGIIEGWGQKRLP